MTGDTHQIPPAEEIDTGWDGEAGRHWVRHQDRHEAMLAALTPRLLGAARVSQADKVLDVGCGCGQTTRIAARSAPDGQVLGVDVSGPMLAEARLRSERDGLTNVGFEHADAETFTFPEGGFDVALSRFGVMFFDDPGVAFANLARALRPGGRLAFLCWQEVTRNEHLMVPFGAVAAHAPLPDLGGPGAPGPFSLADPDRTRTLLGEAGFLDIAIEPVTEPVRIGADLPDTLEYLRGHPMARSMLDKVDPTTTATALRALQEALQPYQSADGVFLGSAAWLVTARR